MVAGGDLPGDHRGRGRAGFATEAASTPWLWRILVAAWLLGATLDAARIARRTPLVPPARRPLGAAVVGVIAVAAVVAAYVGYGAAERATFAAAVDAQGRIDCTTAVAEFDAVTGPYALTLSRDVAAATALRGECLSFTAATRAAEGPDPDAGISGYEAFRHDHAGSVLRPVVDERLADLHLRRADGARTALTGQSGSPVVAADRARTTEAGFTDLLTVLRDLKETAAAQRVPAAMTALAAAAEAPLAAQQFCDVLPVLDYEVMLDAGETGSIPATAGQHRAQALLGCGVAEFRAGRFPNATTQLQKLLDTYPNDPGGPQARAAIIAANVAQQTPDPIPLPGPLNVPGSLRVTLYNVTSGEMTVRMTGTSAAGFTLPGCDGCPSTRAADDDCPDPAGKPAQVVQIDPGLYHVLLTSGSGTTGSVRTVTPRDGIELCVYTLPSSPHVPLEVPLPVPR
ncbi:tetratricopeptide repeat protein [Pseudonocardia sp. GCM10023141]|uniref:tetratricopeptide repeat protein n=1 Tax=Pseudonocardia sp. GCM10023141 TaxID=3252653 RepID=UPI00361CB353